MLEALACNLPVITAPYGALLELFEEGDGLYYARDSEGIFAAVKEVKQADSEIKTRQKVMLYSWVNIVSTLERIYGAL